MEDETYEVLLTRVKHEKQRLFLENYPKSGVTKTTCDIIGINESTPYSWMLKDEVYNKAFQALKKEISTRRIEVHEQNIANVALDPNTKDQSRIFGSLVILRAEQPDKYREKAAETKFTGEITIKSSIPDPDYNKVGKAEEPKQLREGDNNVT